MKHYNYLFLSAACSMLAASATAHEPTVFNVSGAATGGDTGGDLFLDSVNYGGGLVTEASELVFSTNITGFNFNGAREEIRMVSGVNTNGTSGLRRLEAEDGNVADYTQADQDLFNASIQDGFGHGNLNNLFDQRNHSSSWSFVMEFERALTDDDSDDDLRGELLVFERGCDEEVFIQPVDEYGNMLGHGHTVRTSDYIALTPGTNIDKYDNHGVVYGNQEIGGVSLDLSKAFGVTSARFFIVCNTEDNKRDSDFKIIGVDSLGADCDGNGINDLVDIAGGAFDADGNGVLDQCESGTWVYCTGDGQASTTVDCPCGNNVAPGAPEGCLNSGGAGAALSSMGTVSITNADLMLHVSGIPSSNPGVFFAGDVATAGGGGAPFLSGIRCVGGNVVRLAKLPNTPGGQASVPLQGFPPLHQMVGAQPGQTTFFQFWYRDPAGPCGSSANMSNGMRVVWGL